MKTIAHRGACAERPEHTRAAYVRAIEQGCDFIEPDVVMSADGVLVVRHDVEIGQTTNVADHAAFATRHRTALVDGHPVSGWFVGDFTWAELSTLRCRERLPDLRPANTAWKDEPILRLQDVVQLAHDAGVGLIPELKHPAFHALQGQDITAAYVGAMGQQAGLPVISQCFEVEPLVQLSTQPWGQRMQLIAANTGPYDRPDLRPDAMLSPEGLTAIATYAQWIGVEATLLHGSDATGVSKAHAAGLKIAVWTLRPENQFLPTTFQIGDDPAAFGNLAGWQARLGDLGVDAVFTDAPGTAMPTNRA